MKVIIKVSVVLGLLVINVYAGGSYSKSNTNVVGFSNPYPLNAFEGNKYKNVIQTTGTNKTVYRICNKKGSKVTCKNISVKGIVKEIVNFDLSENRTKIHGTYQKFFSVYAQVKGCGQKLWDNKQFEFYYENGEACKDKKKIKYDGFYDNGKKSGTWKIYNKKGDLKSTKTYRN